MILHALLWLSLSSPPAAELTLPFVCRHHISDTVPQQKKDIYVFKPQIAHFAPGMDSLNRFFRQHFKYPDAAQPPATDESVIIKFIVRDKGHITDAAIAGPSPAHEMTAAALRLIRIMPKWKPAKQSGRDVSSWTALRFTFLNSQQTLVADTLTWQP